ncbi:hypothetical protein MRX96_025815 [Rhipicephalus microplus]
MAGTKPPKPFDFQNAADWPAWMDEFDDYRFVSGLLGKNTKFKGAEDTVLRPSKTPRSYWIRTEGKTVRRNRRHLFLLPHGGETSPVRMEQHPRNSKPTDATDKDIEMEATFGRLGASPPLFSCGLKPQEEEELRQFVASGTCSREAGLLDREDDLLSL